MADNRKISINLRGKGCLKGQPFYVGKDLYEIRQEKGNRQMLCAKKTVNGLREVKMMFWRRKNAK